jgi:Excalibur calcium-binding domain
MDKVYPHGVAKNFKVIKKANGLTGRPFVSLKIYNANPGSDRDRDGVACEK